MKKFAIAALTAVALPFAVAAQTPTAITEMNIKNTLLKDILAEGNPMQAVRSSDLPNDMQCIRRAANAARPENKGTLTFVTTYKGKEYLVVVGGHQSSSTVFAAELKEDGAFEYAVTKFGKEHRIAGSMNKDSLIQQFMMPRGIQPFIDPKDAVEGGGWVIRNCETGSGLFPQPLAYSDPAYTGTHTRAEMANRYKAWLKSNTALKPVK